MLRFIARYRIYCILAGLVLAVGCTLPLALSASAASRHSLPPGDEQQNNQAYRGSSFFNNRIENVGDTQANTGNAGENHGFNQDSSGNAGNQVVSQHKAIKKQINNQSFHEAENPASGSGNSSTLIGAFQGNSGNTGINFGNNQDNSGNAGNQVNNQGNIIGTQINKQGSAVTNDGNIILHQVNYLQLFPGLRVYIRLRPQITFAVSIGH